MSKKINEIFNKIKQADKFINDYKNLSVTAEMPSFAYTNWGVQMANRGEFALAAEKFNTALMMVQQNPRAYVNLGIIQMRQQNYTEAIKNFRQAVKIDKYNSKAYTLWASSLGEIGDYKGAVEIYELAQKYDPRNPEIYLSWAVSLAKFEKKDEAEEKFQTAAALDPTNPIVPLLWGVLLFEKRKYEEAIKRFAHSSLYSEDKYDTNYYLSLCYSRMGNYEMAVECASAAYSLRPQCVEPYIVLGEAYMNSGRRDQCFKIFEEAEKNTQKSPSLYISWGIALQKFKRLDEASEKFFSALVLVPNNELLLSSIAINYILKKEYAQAETYLQKVLEVNPKNANALYNLGVVKFQYHFYESALKYFQDAYINSPQNYSIYFNIAECYYNLKNTKEAKKYYEKCIEYNPKHMQAYLNLANILIETNDSKNALRKVRTVYTLNKTSPAVNFAYGIVLMKNNLLDEAMDKFNHTLSIDSNYNTAYLGIAECSLLKGCYNESINALDMVMDKLAENVDFLRIQDLLFEKILIDDTYCEVDYAIKYCNKFLERYNNSKVSEIRDRLIEK